MTATGDRMDAGKIAPGSPGGALPGGFPGTVQIVSNMEYAIGRVSVAKGGIGHLRQINDGERSESGIRDGYDVIIPCDYPMSFCQQDLSGRVEPGQYVLLNRNRFYELSSPEGLRHWRITIPAADLRSRLSSIEDHVGMRFGQNERMARLLRGFVSMVAKMFIEERPPNAEALATEVIGFVTLVLASENRSDAAAGRDSRYRLKQRIFDFIERNLDAEDLSPNTIAKANRISSSYLYSLFSDNNTTVSQFIQARRLQRAYELLVADPGGAVTISEIAYRVGFKNASHFSRSFSRHFHVAPRDARQLGLCVKA